MEKRHRANVLVTSCLKTPVDPHTRAPVALYERERALPCADNQMEYDSGSDLGADDSPAKDISPLLSKDYCVTSDNIDFRQFYFSSQEYYHKLEQLKRAHLHTMAELELMYRKKLELNGVTHVNNNERTVHSCRGRSSPIFTGTQLRKAQSALELRAQSDVSDTSVEEHIADNSQGDLSNYNPEKGLLLSPKEHIKNMWLDFRVRNHSLPHHDLVSSLQSLPGDCQAVIKPKGKVRGQRLKKRKQAIDECWHPRVTVPKPFQMTVREAEMRKKGIKSRSEIERENADLRRQLEELTECQRKFRASLVPAHVRLRFTRSYTSVMRNVDSFIEKQNSSVSMSLRDPSASWSERLKKEQKEARLREQMLKRDKEEEERRKCPFKAKPVPQAVKEAASGEQQKEEELYRTIKMQMRARELLHSASMPPSMLARRITERQAQRAVQEDKQVHRPKINTEVPDFDASYRKFKKQLENCRDVRPLTACEPFKLRTATIASHKERIMADIEAEKQSPRRWPFVTTRALSPGTHSSSLCSSLSGSQEYLSTKITDAARKRQEAVRKVLEQRKKAEEEEEKWKEKQKQREKKLQKVITKRAQANDPHVALAQTCQSKLKEFRKQDLQRRREYQEEMREIQERVKGRPLLLEQVAQINAKRAAEKLFSDTLHGCGLSESFVRSKAPKGLKHRQGTPSPAFSDSQTPPTFRNEDPVDNLQDSSLPDDYPDDYEEYDQDMEEDYVDRDEDDIPNVYHDSDEEEGDDDRQSFDNKLNIDEDDEDDNCDDVIGDRSRGSESDNSHHSNRSGSGSIGSLTDGEKREDQKIDDEC